MAKLNKNLLEAKTIANEDESGIPKYYGYLGRNGAWVIMRYNETTGVYDYAVGRSDYSTNWTNKASLSYTTPEL